MPAAKAKISAGFYAIVGSDEAEVKRAAREQAAQMMPADAGDFGCDTIDGAVQYADDAAARIFATIEALQTFPFFGGEKLVWLKSANFLGDDPLGRSQSVLEALEKLTETLQSGLPDSTRFLLSAVGVDKRRSFYKGLAKLGKVEVFDKVDASKSGWEEQAVAVSRERAERRGLHLGGEALELFALATGGDRGTVENELEKIDLYLGSRRDVAVDDVRNLVSQSREGIVFELGNAIAAREASRSLRLLEQLLFQGESAIGILIVAIIPTMRNLLVVKDLMDRHKLSRPAQPFFFGKALDRLPAVATAHLPRKKDGSVNAYSLGIAASHAHRYRLEELRGALHACLEANLRLVNSSLEPSVVLSQLIVEIATSRPAGMEAAKS